jgi:UDP-glucose 4-epimerase
MKILITGAGGFLGKCLINKLGPKHEVTATSKDIKEFGKSKITRANIKSLDVTSTKSCFDIIRHYDVVIHLAAIIDVSYSLHHPKEVMAVNFEGTFNILEAMRKNGVKKIVYLSSQDIYGNNTNSSESNLNSIAPLNPYALSKFLSESLIKIYGSAYGIKHLILRPSHLYGKGQVKGIIPMLLEKIRKGDTVEIGNNVKRDFLNVEDLANAVELTLSLDKNDIINVGTGKSSNLKEVIKMIGAIYGKELTVNEIESLKRDDKLERWDEVSNISRLLAFNYKPKWDIKSWLDKNI